MPNTTTVPIGTGSTYDGYQHGTEIIVTGAGGKVLQDTILTHVNAGPYTDKWAGYTDPKGIYSSVNGLSLTETIAKATAVIHVVSYDALYNGTVQKATGTATGVGGVAVAGLNLANTGHVNPGKYTDTWTFSDPNYVSQSGTVTDVITSPPIALITTLYQEILGRTPDQGGLTGWANAVNSGATLSQIATSFWNSPEHLAHPIGNLNTATQDASNAFVNTLYQDVLGRTGDTGGVAGWDQVLNSNSATPNQVAIAFWNSPEHQAKFNAGTAPVSSYGVVVAALYNELLGRTPDTGGLNAWVNILYSGALTQDQMVQCFTTSPEFAVKTNKLLTNDFVTRLYNNILHRAPDATGLAMWDRALDSGTMSRASVVRCFWDSPENSQNLPL